MEQDGDTQEVFSASFSPDGTQLIYSRRYLDKQGNDIWQFDLATGESRLLYHTPENVILYVGWSPAGDHITFTQWNVMKQTPVFTLGELWVMQPDGTQLTKLGSVVTGYYYSEFLQPQWSRDGQNILFLLRTDTPRSEELHGLRSNLFQVNVQTGQVEQLTDLHDTTVLAPQWGPGNKLTFMVNSMGQPDTYQPWLLDLTQRKAQPFVEQGTDRVLGDGLPAIMAWLPKGE